MRTIIAVIAGLAVTGLLVVVGNTNVGQLLVTTDASGSVSVGGALVALAWSFVALVLGAMVTARFRQTKEAMSGFIVGELFFGVGLLHQFWHAPAWYSVIAMLLVIPGAMLGYWIAFRSRIEMRASV